VIIARRFRGPPDSGNGGYVCGAVGTLLPGPAEVTLRSPPPLDRELRLERTGEGAVLRDGESVVAEAVPATVDIEPPGAVRLEEAEKASRKYPWFQKHPYPSCFVCGPERRKPDGLCIFPGPVEGRKVAAAPFLPDASLAGEDGKVRPEILWAALDCPSWYGMYCFQEWQGMAMLGRLAARIDDRPRAGDRCVCVGWSRGNEGRKIHAGSAVYSENGALLALGKATWIALK
jgi:hypothetical protein